MCGIAGILKLSGPVTSQEVTAVLRMLDAEIHRGPNDWGILFPDSVANDAQVLREIEARGRGHDFSYRASGSGVSAVLGTRRLSILDLSEKARMPMGSHDGRTWITYNGEIYNFRELRAELIGRGYSFRSESDTEVLLHGYEEWGEDLIPRLHGMFAFAVLRTGARPALLLAKDRFGIKPLYYFADDERLLFASEVRSLLASGLVPQRHDLEAMVRFLQLGSVPLPLTTVRGVCALPAAHLLATEDGKIRVRQYWDLGQCFRNRKEADKGEDRVLRLLTDSVRAHSVSDVPLGIFLSGGIDSSALVALASLAGQRPVKTVTLTFEEPEYDESLYARAVARKYGTQHGEVRLTQGDFFQELPRIFGAMDQPTVDGVNAYFVSKAAKALGLTVVFAGTGADEIFLGYQHLRQAASVGRISQVMARIPKPLRSRIVRTAYNVGIPYGRRERLTYLNRPTWENMYLLIRGLFAPQQIQQFLGITEREVRDLGLCIPASHQTPDTSFADFMVSLEFHHYLQNQLLKDTDFMSMSHSIEARVPYLDNCVVEYVLGVPARRRLQGHTPKPLLVKALGDRLPQSVWDRPKQGFSFPFGEWLRSDRGSLEADVQARRLFESHAVQELWAQFRQGRVHWSRPWALSVLTRAMEAEQPVAAARAAAVPAVSLRAPAEVAPASLPAPAPARSTGPGGMRRGALRAGQQHVLVLLTDLLDAFGGIQTFNRSLVKALDGIAVARRWPVELLVLNDRRRAHCESPYFDPEAVAYRSFQRNSTQFVSAAVRAASRATTAIIGHVNFCPVLPLMKVSATAVDFILVVHGIEVWKPLSLLQRWGVRQLNEVLTVSDFTRDEMRLHNQVNGLSFTTFPDTLDPFYGGADAGDARARLGLPAGRMLLSVSRLHETEFYKRIDLILESMPAVLKQAPDVFLVVVGEGRDRARLQRLAAQLRLDDRVRFTGRVSEEDLPLYYQACDVFVLPSLKEGFGIVFLEAMQYAKPCIGARAAAVPEVIVDGESGLLTAPGDARSLELAITALLSDEALRQAMGRAGLRRLETNFSFSAFRHRLEEVLCRPPA
ncbi:MAG: asparagine synthase (glutamine-hydrolyzing) [Acidobacteriia bacterium]|nr:asparagine synthase (glutamine-hydrolyzing) [Terriglobia bacterium]